MASKNYPRLDQISVNKFYGLNRHESGRGGSNGGIDAFDMSEITAAEFPTAKVRRARQEIEFPVGYKKKDVVQAHVPTMSSTDTDYWIAVNYDTDLADVTKVSLPFAAQSGLPESVEGWYDVEVSADYVSAGDTTVYCTIYTFRNRAEGRRAILTAVGIVTQAQIIGRWYGTTPGAITDVCVIGDRVFLATEDGSIVGKEAICRTGIPIRQIVPMGRLLFTDSGFLTDDELSAPKRARIRVPDFYDAGGYHLTGSATVALVDADGATITPVTSKPSNPSNGDYWYDDVTRGLYQYSSAQDMWTAVLQSYIQITFGASQTEMMGLKKGDAIRLKIGTEITSSVVYAVADKILTVTGLTNNTGTQTVSAERRMPEMDFICEHYNRIWGVRYGENDDGEFVNEIYASAQGDPLNWFLYEGTTHDSWTSSVGAPGPWTGITECGEYVLAFKADRIFVISGKTPSTFGYTEIEDWGCQPDSDKSICVIDNYCYYKSEHGIMRIGPYNYPVCISRALGDDEWRYAVAGTDGRRYYISMAVWTGERSMYVYDTETGIWTRESEPVTGIRTFCRLENNLAAIGLKKQFNDIITGLRIDYDPPDEDFSAVFGAVSREVTRRHPRELTTVTRFEGGTNPANMKTLIDEEEILYIKTGALYYATLPQIVFVSDERPDAYRFVDMQIASFGMSGWDVSSPEVGTAVAVMQPEPEWYYETVPLGLETPDEKRIQKIMLRVKAGRNAEIRLLAAYDNGAEWEELAHRTGVSGTYRIAYAPARRCDTFKLRIEGRGAAVIYGLYIVTEGDGDYAH